MAKRIALADIKVGMKVVVSEAADTQVYVVDKTMHNGRYVHLSYTEAGKKMSGGWVDSGVCMRPSALQEANNAA